MQNDTPAPYVPRLGIVYPDNPDAHMNESKKVVDDPVLDEHYPYLDKSLSFRIWDALLNLAICILASPLSAIRFGLRLEGQAVLRKHRALLRNGAMTVSNHVLRWDFLMLYLAVRYRRLHYPAWPENLTGPDRHLIRLTGGIPVPRNIHAIRQFNAAFDELHQKKKWFHVFPESSNWHYFQPIRPFKKGMFTVAYRYNLPVIPLAFSWRPARGIYRLVNHFLGKDYPLVTLRMGEPILPDVTKPRREAVDLLRRQVHQKIVELAGITDNPYPCEGD